MIELRTLTEEKRSIREPNDQTLHIETFPGCKNNLWKLKSKNKIIGIENIKNLIQGC